VLQAFLVVEKRSRCLPSARCAARARFSCFQVLLQGAVLALDPSWASRGVSKISAKQDFTDDDAF